MQSETKPSYEATVKAAGEEAVTTKSDRRDEKKEESTVPKKAFIFVYDYSRAVVVFHRPPYLF